MVQGRARRRLDAWLIAAMAVLLVGTGGPSLVLSDLDVHVALGLALAAATAGHLWLHRRRAVAWLPTARPVRRSRRPRRWWLPAQDAGRELAFALTLVSGLVLLAGGAGETMHLLAGFALLGLVAVHVVLHRAWFARALSRRRVGV